MTYPDRHILGFMSICVDRGRVYMFFTFMYEKELADILNVTPGKLKDVRLEHLFEGVDWILEPYKRTGRVVYTEIGIENATRILAFSDEADVLDDDEVTVINVPKNRRMLKVQDRKGNTALCAVPVGLAFTIGTVLPVRPMNDKTVKFALNMAKAKDRGILKRVRKSV